MHLFIDTNIYLKFYLYCDDDLEELRKLLVSLETKAIRLYVPQQVVDEFERNRETKIFDTLDALQKTKLPKNFPQLSQHYGEYANLRKLLKDAQINLDKITEQLREDCKNQTLKADEIIRLLFAQAEKIDISGKILSQAKLRCELGNPPGKNNSLGDSINWESLLEVIPNEEDLFFITDDSDYVSKTDPNNLKDFLIFEWTRKKNSKLHYYKRLTNFFLEKFPNIKIATEMAKQIAIDDLIKSASFRDTHLALSKIEKYLGSFSVEEIDFLISSAENNSQISSICNDLDVKNFFKRLVIGHEDKILPENLAVIKGWYPLTQPIEDILEEP